ncbi:hypothetical protein [Sphingomonas sp. BK481]|uniref:hypothetical protein n=1 Tax=Sphingomonas sp. BK481 TaxID=2586981 RepID=UPI00160B2AE1|nr:hypothetical protein [Sphingomonas sp. BK481]MBB3585976.1 hypothetical protein [Sphingomonas sp. BK481]
MTLVILALVSFVQVFALGFQSKNVNHGNYGWAAGTSFFIGISQAAVWRRITGPDATSTRWSGTGSSDFPSKLRGSLSPEVQPFLIKIEHGN